MSSGAKWARQEGITNRMKNARMTVVATQDASRASHVSGEEDAVVCRLSAVEAEDCAIANYQLSIGTITNKGCLD